MTGTITLQFAKKQALIQQKRARLMEHYPSLWRSMIAGWTSNGDDAAWLMYSANVLFRTGGVRWAIDPLTLSWRVPSSPQMDIRQDLKHLSFVLLTHEHRDHLDLMLIDQLAHLPIRWIVPEFLVPKILHETNLAQTSMLIPQPLQPFSVNGLQITPFDAVHRVDNMDGSVRGVPEMGYLVEQAGRRWLFPGDVRVFDNARFPSFGGIDLVFAHLWLGRAAALTVAAESVEAFCSFYAAFHPHKVVITHLEEYGRDANDFLEDEHAQKAVSLFGNKYPGSACSVLHIGEKVLL